MATNHTPKGRAKRSSYLVDLTNADITYHFSKKGDGEAYINVANQIYLFASIKPGKREAAREALQKMAYEVLQLEIHIADLVDPELPCVTGIGAVIVPNLCHASRASARVGP